MTHSNEVAAVPLPPHLGPDFYLWLLVESQQDADLLSTPDLGKVTVWPEDRIVFRAADSNRPDTVLTGFNPGRSRACRAAIRDGRVIEQIRLGIRRDDREFTVTLVTPGMHILGLKLPVLVVGDSEEALYDRMFLYEEAHLILTQLFQRFCEVRTLDWPRLLERVREWLGEEDGELDDE